MTTKLISSHFISDDNQSSEPLRRLCMVFNGHIEHNVQMSAPPKELTPNELSERILRLENDIADLRKQQASAESLEIRVSELESVLKNEITNTTKHINSLYDELQHVFQYLSDIHDQLRALVQKVFPGSAETQNQIATIIKSAGRRWDDKKPEK